MKTDDEKARKVTELMRESARFIVETNGDGGFYNGREIWEARRFLERTEPVPDAWAGRLPGLENR